MVKNGLIKFTCPKCAEVLEEHRGHINQEFFDFVLAQNNAPSTPTATADHDTKIRELQMELDKLNEENQALKIRRQNIESGVTKRARDTEGNTIFHDQFHFVTDLVKNILEQSQKSNLEIFSKLETTIGKFGDGLTKVFKRMDKIESVIKDLTVSKPVQSVNSTPSRLITQTANSISSKESLILSEIKHKMTNAAPSIKLTMKCDNEQVLRDILMPFRTDGIIMSMNLLNMFENGNQFILSFKTQADITNVTNYIAQTYGHSIEVTVTKEFKPAIKIIGIYLRRNS